MGHTFSLETFTTQEPTQLALGFFDGFHRGHQAIVRRATAGAKATVFTFKNHPATVLNADRAPKLLTTFEERQELINQAGADLVYCTFDRPFSQIPAEQFVEDILIKRLRARLVVIGENYRFGHRAQGNAELLQQLSQPLGFEVAVVAPVKEKDWISSTRIRALVKNGEVTQACKLLGRPFFIRSLVEKGDGRGRTIGFPTANLGLPPTKVHPSYGVYAVRVDRGQASLKGVANLGVRPTFEGSAPVLEVHLFDYDGYLYGEKLNVHFVERLRGEQKFSGVDALVAQIGQDVEAARKLFS